MYIILAEVPGVACRIFKNRILKNKKIEILAGYREHIYDCLVLFYRYGYRYTDIIYIDILYIDILYIDILYINILYIDIWIINL